MRTALYDENQAERQLLIRYLRQCGQENLRPVEVVPFDSHVDFCRAVVFDRASFDLLVVAQDGTFSLEVIDEVRKRAPELPVIWFSDLDFAIRSYIYGTAWFGKKPVELPAMRQAFIRALSWEQTADKAPELAADS